MQELDSLVDQLRHRRNSLPELAELSTVEAELATIQDRVLDARIALDDLTKEQAKAEADVEQVRTRRERDRQRMDSGAITNPKDLQNMSHELETLERRISTLEDAELEVMERLEEAQGIHERLLDEATALDHRRADLVASRDEKTAVIDAEAAQTSAGREPLVAEIPQDLLALYEKLRAAKAGVGAALLRARQCGGCMLTVDAAEIEAFRAAAPDEVIRCEECQRILVRTDESGL